MVGDVEDWETNELAGFRRAHAEDPGMCPDCGADLIESDGVHTQWHEDELVALFTLGTIMDARDGR